MFIHWLKGCYQYISIKINLYFSNLFSPTINDLELLRKKLSDRGFFWTPNQKTKVIAIFSVSNWEGKLLDALNVIGPVSHITWDHINDFYSDKTTWESEIDLLNKRIQKQFDGVYDIESNIFVFMYVSDFTINIDTLNYIRQKNVLIVNFCWDDLLYFKSKYKGQRIGVSSVCQNVDFNLTFSPEAIPRYHLRNSPIFFWSSYPNFNVKKDLTINQIRFDSKIEFYVLFIGSKYGWRADFIKRLVQKGIKVVCYGSGWENGTISEVRMGEEIRNAPITLGFANVGYTRSIATIKGRDFEVPAYGGLYLTQYSEGLEQYYESGKEIFTYSNLNECIDLINTIKTDPKLAYEVRIAGYQKSLAHCSWLARGEFLSKLIKKVY